VVWLSAADEVELVAFRVGQGDPAVAVLLDLADPARAQTDESADFGLPVGGGQVEMQPFLMVLPSGKVPVQLTLLVVACSPCRQKAVFTGVFRAAG
jgi:hypothetical protein